jgi:hypothetical protein
VHGREAFAAAHGRLAGALVSGNVGGFARGLGAPARAALEQAYRVGFTGALTTILEIGAGIALLASAAGFLLVRQSDFVKPDQTHEPGGSQEAVGVAA